jgi:serine/threonine protein kinase/TolA-binding protein
MSLGTADTVSPTDDAGSVDMRLMWAHPLGRVVARPKTDDAPACMITMLDPAVRAERTQDLDAIVALGRAIERLECDQLLCARAARRSATGRIIVESDAATGSSLSVLADAAALSLERAVGILRQVAHGLAVAHVGGVMHGALSQGSVIVDRERGDVVRIADFGLGRLSWETLERAPATQPTSPERVLGLVPTPAEDVYLFGCIAYTLLAGRPPFEDIAAAELRRRHAIEDVPDLTHMASGRQIPAPIVAVVERCLAKDAEDRYANGSALEIAWCKAQIATGIGTQWDELPLPTTTAEADRATLTSGFEALAAASRPAPKLEARSLPAEPARPLSAEAPARIPPAPSPSPPPPPPRASPPPPPPPPRPASPPLPPVEVRLPSSSEASPVSPSTAEPEPASPDPDPLDMLVIDEEATGRIPVASSLPAKRRSVLPWVALVVLIGLGGAGAVVMNVQGAGELLGIVATPSPPAVESPDQAAPTDELAQPPAEPDAAVEVEAEPDAEKVAEPVEVVVPTAVEHEDAEPETARDVRSVDAAAPRKPDAVAEPEEREPTEPTEPKADASELLQQAKQKRKAGQNAAAEALYEQALARQPRNKAALCALGELAFAKGDAATAAKYFSRARKVDPKDADVRIQLGDALFKLGRYEKARAEFAKAAASGHPSAIRRLQLVDAKLSK